MFKNFIFEMPPYEKVTSAQLREASRSCNVEV